MKNSYVRITCLFVCFSTLVACGGSSSPATPSPPATINVPPVADAGPDQQATEGDKVELLGKATDVNNNITQYKWTQLSGTAVQLNNANTTNANFIAPVLDADETLVFSFTLTDSAGASHQDTLEVHIVKQSPSYTSTTYFTYDTVMLDCLTEFPDLASDAQIHWRQTDGPKVELHSPEQCQTHFKTVGQPATYSFTLSATANGNSRNTRVDINTSEYLGQNLNIQSNPFHAEALYSEYYEVGEPSWTYAIETDGNFQYRLVGNRLQVLRATGQSITEISSVAITQSNYLKLLVRDRLAYIIHREGIDVVDLSDPYQPVNIGYYDMDSMIWAKDALPFKQNIIVSGNVLIRNGLLYIGYAFENAGEGDVQGAYYGYQILDLAIPQHPRFLAHVSKNDMGPEITQQLINEDNAAYFWDGCALVSGAIDSAERWQRQTCPQLFEYFNITVGHIAYHLGDAEIRDGNTIYPLHAQDVSTPDAPLLAGKTYSWAYPKLATVTKQGVMLSLSNNQIQILNYDNPLQPYTQAVYSTENWAKDLAVTDHVLYLAMGDRYPENSGGLHAIELNKLKQSKGLAFQAAKGSVLAATFSYQQQSIEQTECRTTTGHCTAVLDKVGRTITLSWTIGDIAGDHEMVLLAGNANYFVAAREQVRVTAH